jgi:signal transduction histidine kinase/ActR/RegA family two-component response regulator
VAVHGVGDGAHSAARSRTRRGPNELLALAQHRAALEQMPLVGGVMLSLLPLGAWTASSSSEPHGGSWAWAWAGASAVLGLVLLFRPWRRWRATPSALPVALAAAAVALAALPLAVWNAAAQPTWVSVLCVVTVAVAAATAPVRPAMAAAGATALLASALLAARSPALALPLAWAGLLALAVGWRLHRRWRRTALQGLDQVERLQSLQAERDAALRNDHDKSRFLAIASHDLRQPVHALGLFAATLHKRLMQSPDEPLGRNLMRSVDGLERSFNAMLDISRLDGGAVTPKFQSFPLRDLFRRLHMQYGGQAELAGLGLRFSPGGKFVASDPQLLERILGNLVQNAIRYTTSGGIVVVARSTRTHVNIEVWDTGSGIAADDLPRIFEEFYQVGRGERDRSQGLGMGLSIVKRLAAVLHHRLEVVSTPGRGTVFRVGVQLGPLDGMDEETAAADTLPMQVDEPQMVLVVDDEEPIREGLRLLLQEWGYQVMTASDAAQAETAVSAMEGRIDLILSDLHLGPGPGGQEVVANVRRLCGRHVPALLVTGDTAGDALREVAAGADPVLFKPVQPRHLFEAMRAALQRPAGSFE